MVCSFSWSIYSSWVRLSTSLFSLGQLGLGLGMPASSSLSLYVPRGRSMYKSDWFDKKMFHTRESSHFFNFGQVSFIFELILVFIQYFRLVWFGSPHFNGELILVIIFRVGLVWFGFLQYWHRISVVTEWRQRTAPSLSSSAPHCTDFKFKCALARPARREPDRQQVKQTATALAECPINMPRLQLAAPSVAIRRALRATRPRQQQLNLTQLNTQQQRH